MLQKYTKFCTADTLIKNIETENKDQQAMHILLSVFKKPLSWVEEKFDREGLFDAIQRITVKMGIVSEPLLWMFVIKGSFTYHDMPFYMSQYIKFTQPPQNHLSFSQNGVYATLTLEDYNSLMLLHQQRQAEKIQKFIKINMFYPYYLQDHHVKEFYSLIRIKRLKYNKYLNWKDQDHSNKIAVIFRGLINIEYQWKRTIQVAQLAKGMFIANHYIKDQLQQIQELQWQKVDEQPQKKQKFPKFKYISKSDDTLLLIFNVRLVSESPYNINPDLLPNIKQSYENYMESLQNTIGLAEYNKLYRNKSSIKEQLKKKKQKQQIKKEITLDMSNIHKLHSPLVKTFATLQLQTHPFDSIRTIQLPQPNKQYSKSVFTTIPHVSPSRSQRSKTTEIRKTFSSRKMIHNTWLQQMSKKKKHVKSFSMLRNLTTYNPDRHKKEQQFIEQLKAEKEKKPEFFVPDQFVKRKLRLKYEGLIDKMRHMDLKTTKGNEEPISQKMQRLQQYIDSKRIVKIGNAKRKFKLLRDKVEY